MSRVELPYIVQDTTGTALSGASVAIYIRDTNTLAPIFVSEVAGGPSPNPVITITGRIPGWVNPGSYDLIVTGSNFTYTRSFEAVRGDTTLSSKTMRIAHTWHLPGLVVPEIGPSDLVNYILPFYVSPAALETTAVVGYRCSLGTGTSCPVKVQKNGVDLLGFTGISVTTTDSGAYPTAQLVAANDKLKLIVTGPGVGSPGNLAFTLFVEHTA